MKRLVFIFFLALSFIGTFAQNSTQNTIQLGYGFGNIMRQDLTVSQFIHKDWSPVNVLLKYEHSKNLYHQVTLKFSLYAPKPTQSYEFTSFYNGALSTIPHSFKMIDLDYSLGKKMVNNIKYYLVAGGKANNYIYASDYYFGESGPSPMMISFGLDAWGLLHYQLYKSHYLQSVISIPILSFVYRNPYLNEDDSYHNILFSHNGIKELGGRIAASKLRSWGNAQSIELNCQYGYTVNKTFDIGLTYHYSINLNQYPTRFTQFENVFFLNGKIKF